MKNISDLTVAVVGCGNIARIAWGPNFQALGVGRLLCFDVDPIAAAAFAAEFGGETFDRYEDLLVQQPHGVVIATPPAYHYDPAMSALRAGAHLMVEKPMTADLAQATRLVRAADALGLMIHQPFHQLIMLSHVIRKVVEGELGDVTTLTYRWQRRWQDGSDLLDDLGPHAIAMVLALLGDGGIESVRAARIGGHDLVVLDRAGVNVVIRIESGITRLPQEERIALTVGGTNGSLKAFMRTTKTPGEEEFDYRPELVLTAGPESPDVLRLDGVSTAEDARTTQAAMWLDCLRHGHGVMPVDGARGRTVQALLDAAKAAARDGVPVRPADLG